MKMQSRIESLRTRHATIDTRMCDEDNRPSPDQGMVTRLKLEKLRIKDEMERLHQRM